LGSSVLTDEVSWVEPELCDGLVLYEDTPTRNLAMRLYDGLSSKFKADLEFRLNWYAFKYLCLPEIAHQAGQEAVKSNLLFVSIHHVADLPLEVISWLEVWLPQRICSEGALVLLQSTTDTKIAAPWQESYLRTLSERANLDYFIFPESRQVQVSWDRLREDHVVSDTTGLTQPPTHQHHSSGWGINE